ncbi:MAG TPA: dTMP kinase [Bacillota bacterium]|jgi:dTMP kinase|nr:dTMP kinase [Bacillota bacterium]
MRRGIFITFEGPDGAGKTTQIHRLRDYLISKGTDLVLTREPGGTRIGEKIREIILDPEYQEMADLTEALLYASSRAQHVAEVIFPALKSGKTVICDRFMDSSIAYQGYGRKLGEKVRIINEIAVLGLIPDLTFLLLVDPGEGRRRISDGFLDRLELEEMQYHEEVYRGYMELAAQNTERMIVIDGSLKIDEISVKIIKETTAFLRRHQG